MELENQLPQNVEKIFCEIKSWEKAAPGVYFITGQEEGRCFQEYYAVLNYAPFFSRIQKYGRPFSTFLLFELGDDLSGWRIVEYEWNRYRVKNCAMSTAVLRDTALHAAEYHPEYFGQYPVPADTPFGCTLCHCALDNGVYWLETDQGREVLALCGPIWRAELSDAARKLGTVSAEYLFFPARASCIPIFELMETRKSWDGELIDREALMNAIWVFLPSYALARNGQEQLGKNDLAAMLLAGFGVEIEPQILEKDLIGIFPDRGTDFLLLSTFSL